jgi:hypothetical protein
MAFQSLLTVICAFFYHSIWAISCPSTSFVHVSVLSDTVDITQHCPVIGSSDFKVLTIKDTNRYLIQSVATNAIVTEYDTTDMMGANEMSRTYFVDGLLYVYIFNQQDYFLCGNSEDAFVKRILLSTN